MTLAFVAMRHFGASVGWDEPPYAATSAAFIRRSPLATDKRATQILDEGGSAL
jgi:hypothetical protein